MPKTKKTKKHNTSWYLDIWSLILNGKTRELKVLGAGEKEIKVIGKRELCRYLGFWEQTL